MHVLPAVQRAERLFGESQAWLSLLPRRALQSRPGAHPRRSLPPLLTRLQQPAAAVVRCKLWSFRAADGACRLYAPDAAGRRAVTWLGGGSLPPELHAWFSGSAERPQVLNPAYRSPPEAEPQQQCLTISPSTGGSFPGGDGGGGLSGGGGGGVM